MLRRLSQPEASPIDTELVGEYYVQDVMCDRMKRRIARKFQDLHTKHAEIELEIIQDGLRQSSRLSCRKDNTLPARNQSCGVQQETAKARDERAYAQAADDPVTPSTRSFISPEEALVRLCALEQEILSNVLKGHQSSNRRIESLTTHSAGYSTNGLSQRTTSQRSETAASDRLYVEGMSLS